MRTELLLRHCTAPYCTAPPYCTCLARQHGHRQLQGGLQVCRGQRLWRAPKQQVEPDVPVLLQGSGAPGPIRGAALVRARLSQLPCGRRRTLHVHAHALHTRVRVVSPPRTYRRIAYGPWRERTHIASLILNIQNQILKTSSRGRAGGPTLAYDSGPHKVHPLCERQPRPGW